MHIRPATLDDCARLSAVLREAFEAFRELYTPAAFAATCLSPEQIGKRLEEGPVWLAELDGNIVGTVSLLPGDREGYVRGMAVLPGTQGKGVGLALLQQTAKFARENGFHRLYLRTTPYLTKAIRLYEMFGFAAIGSEEPFYGTPSYLMEKKLIR